MAGNRANWAALALTTALGAALACAVAALFAPGGPSFAGLLAAGAGLGGTTIYAVFALREANLRIAKLSDELTSQSQRLLRLESAISERADASVGRDIEALTRATAGIAEAVGGHDERLTELEQRAMMVASPSLPATEPAPGTPQAISETVAEASDLRLASREDFSRAAKAIIGRLSSEPPQREPAPPADEAVLELLDTDSLELWLQPIVTLPQRHVRFYDAVPHLRGPDGQPIGPDALRPILTQRRLIERFDAMAFNRVLSVASRLAEAGRDTAIRLPLSRATIGNQTFIDAAISRLRNESGAAAHVVIDVASSDAEDFSALENEALARLRAQGLRASVSSAPTLDLDWTSLGRRGYALVSLDAETILGPRPHATTAFLVAGAARAGLSLVATRIERESQVPDLLDFDVPLALGPAIAPARPVRTDVLRPQNRLSAETAQAPQEESRASFRDFLRRAAG